jgi:hypothetical protein
VIKILVEVFVDVLLHEHPRDEGGGRDRRRRHDPRRHRGTMSGEVEEVEEDGGEARKNHF